MPPQLVLLPTPPTVKQREEASITARLMCVHASRLYSMREEDKFWGGEEEEEDWRTHAAL